MLHKIITVLVVVFVTVLCACSSKGKSPTRYLPADCSARLYVNGDALDSLWDAAARKLAADEIADADSPLNKLAIALKALPGGVIPTKLEFEAAACMTAPGAGVVVIKTDHFADFDALASDAHLYVDALIQLTGVATSPFKGVGVDRDRVGGVRVLKFSKNGTTIAWATLIDAHNVVVSTDAAITPDMIKDHEPTWVLTDSPIVAVNGERGGINEIVVSDHKTTIDVSVAKNLKSLKVTKADLQHLSRWLHHHWPALETAIDGIQLDNSADNHAIQAIQLPRSAFATQNLEATTASRQDTETLCDPVKQLPFLGSIALAGHADMDAKYIALYLDAVDEDVIAPDVRKAVKAIRAPNADTANIGTIARALASQQGVNSCPLADQLEWQALCQSDDAGALKQLPADSPVAREVLAQPEAKRGDYIQSKASAHHLRECPLSAPTSLLRTMSISERDSTYGGGKIAPEAVRQVVQKSDKGLIHCYLKGTRRPPSFQFTMMTKFVIKADGTVDKAAFESGTVQEAVVQECVVGLFNAMKFPAPVGGPVNAHYGLLFENNFH